MYFLRLFIYDLFNDAVGSLDQSNGGMVSGC
jgi:hypothetical protein